MATKVRYKHYTMQDWAIEECKDDDDLRDFINQMEFYGAEYHIQYSDTQINGVGSPGMRSIYK